MSQPRRIERPLPRPDAARLMARVRLSKFTIGAGMKILASSACTWAEKWLKPPAGRELRADKLVGGNACLDDDRR